MVYKGSNGRAVWRISPISMWELKGCDGSGNPTMIDMPT